MVKCSKKAYLEYPTVVNKLKESGLTYKNNMLEYARMDNKFSKCKMGIGESSNLAQLAMTYYWNDTSNIELYNNFIILAVLAQVIIDGCKREYEVDALEEIERIKRMDCMQRIFEIEENGEIKKVKRDFPLFMKYTKEIAVTSNGKDRNQEDIKRDKDKLENRIDESLICPMNYLQDVLDEIKPCSKNRTTPTSKFFIKMEGNTNRRQMSKIRKMIEEYDNYTRSNLIGNDYSKEDLIEKTEEMISSLKGIRICNIVTINRLIEVALGLDSKKKTTQLGSKYSRKMLNLLYRMNKEKFLMNFIGN